MAFGFLNPDVNSRIFRYFELSKHEDTMSGRICLISLNNLECIRKMKSSQKEKRENGYMRRAENARCLIKELTPVLFYVISVLAFRTLKFTVNVNFANS